MDATDRRIKGVPFTTQGIARVPEGPGVYLFRDQAGDLLYVGKAKNLRARLRSYLSRGSSMEVRTRELARRTSRVETLIVRSEAEALILEANLIKERRPRHNIQLKDDKRYPYVKATVGEDFPRVFFTRRLQRDGARYFGPFVAVSRVRRAVEIVKKLHAVRSCRYRLPKEAPDRPCLDYHIGRCRAPCVGLQSKEEYRREIDRLLRVLGGDVAGVQAQAEKEMRDASAKLEFERAANLRDVVQGLDWIARRQTVESAEMSDLDAIGLARDGPRAAVAMLRVRRGTLLGREARCLDRMEHATDEELLRGVAGQTYLLGAGSAAGELPQKILAPVAFEERDLLSRILSERAGRRVQFLVPIRGRGVRILELAQANARQALEDRGASDGAPRTDDVLYELQERLGLKVVPRAIVCFDVSHTQGSEAVASAALFVNGEPERSGYRRMRIRDGKGNDDVASMREAVYRYFRRVLEEERTIPELALVDGGSGQLGAAASALRSLELRDVLTAAIAKPRDEILRPGAKKPIRLGRYSGELHLLQRLRDEAHRLAVGYNRALRTKRTVSSKLDDVPGVGPKRRKALLLRFGSVRALRQHTAEEIGRVPGIGPALGARILAYLGKP